MNLNELDFENIGSWPLGARIIAAVIVFALVLGGGFYYFIQDSIAELEKVELKEEPLKKEFREKQGKASNLEAYKQQMADMEKRFGSMLRQLPQKTEVADLLVEISQTGLSNNLEFSLFKPLEEIRKEFYAELPVNIKVTGGYHDFGNFASGIAALPRIVTIHDVQMKPVSEKEIKDKRGNKVAKPQNIDSDKKLTITLVAKTYRYLDEDELESSNSKTKKRRRSKK